MNDYSEENMMTYSTLEHIRLRPALYIGALESSGITQLLFEVIANSADQFLLGKATEIVIEIGEDWFSVWDDGPGFPIKPGEEGWTYLTELRNTPTADGHLPHIHLVSLGVGIVVVNALAKRMEIESLRSEIVWRLVSEYGELSKSQEATQPSITKGTRIKVWPDAECLKAVQPQAGFVRRTLFHAVHLMPGLKIRLNEETFHAPGGLAALADFYLNQPSDRQSGIFHLIETKKGLRIEVALAGTRERKAKAPMVYSWVNGSLTEDHGSHVNGLRLALRKVDWRPSIWLIHVLIDSPFYEGRTKNKLGNPEVAKIVRTLVTEALTHNRKTMGADTDDRGLPGD